MTFMHFEWVSEREMQTCCTNVKGRHQKAQKKKKEQKLMRFIHLIELTRDFFYIQLN